MTTTENLIHLRTGFQSRRVYWILPARPDATRALIETRSFTGQDGLHLPALELPRQCLDCRFANVALSGCPCKARCLGQMPDERQFTDNT